MAFSTHVNGTAVVSFGGSQLGISIDGIDIHLHPAFEDIHTDSYGTTAYDTQYMLGEATISMELVLYDNAVLDDVLAIVDGVSPGTQIQAGSLMVAGGLTKALNIDTTGNITNEDPWTFPTAFPTSCRAKEGTRKTVWNLEFRAMNTQEAFNSNGAILFTRT